MSLGYEKVVEALRLANKQQLDEATLASVRQYLREQDDRDEWLKTLIQPGTNKINSKSIQFPYSPIYSTVFEADAATIVVPIPPIYKHLTIYSMGRDTSSNTSSTALTVQINADAGSNYDLQTLTATGTTVAGVAVSATTYGYAGSLAGGNQTAGKAAAAVAHIPHYGSSFFKTILANWQGYPSDSAYSSTVAVTQWKSTAPIYSLTFGSWAANIAAGTVLSVYGVM